MTKYIKSISNPTGIEFDIDIPKEVDRYRQMLKHPVVKHVMGMDEEQEQIDFVRPKKNIPVTLTVEGDCISRAELLKAIDTWDKFGIDDTNHLFRLDNLSLPHYVPYIHYDDVIKCIKGMPSVKSQESKTDVLNKIRKEIEQYNQQPNHHPCDMISISTVLQIINKYRKGANE